MNVNVGTRSVEITNPRWLAAIHEQLRAYPKGRHPDEPSPLPKRATAADLRSIERLSAWINEMRRGPGVFIPIYLRNPLNNMRHWKPTARDRKAARGAARDGCAAERVRVAFPVRVRVTRFGPRRMDKQNLEATVKPIVDGVADYFGRDDGDEAAYEWAPPEQGKSPTGCYGVRIEFEYIDRGACRGGGTEAAGVVRGLDATRPRPVKPRERKRKGSGR